MAKALPRIPRVVYCPAGPVRVVRVKKVVAPDGVVCWGLWEPTKRVIYLEQGLAPEAAYRWYLHELYHAYLDDSNIDLPDKICERVVDALATAQVNAMWWRISTTRRTP